MNKMIESIVRDITNLNGVELLVLKMSTHSF